MDKPQTTTTPSGQNADWNGVKEPSLLELLSAQIAFWELIIRANPYSAEAITAKMAIRAIDQYMATGAYP